MNIDWSKAPDGATHCDINDKTSSMWMAFTHIGWFYSTGKFGWLKYCEDPDESSFMPRPTQQPPQWNGEGLPPVGTVCNIKIDGGTNGVIVAHVTGKLKQGAIIQCEGDWWYGDARSFTPIKSERDRQIDAIEALIYRSECETTSAAERLYNAGCRIGSA